MCLSYILNSLYVVAPSLKQSSNYILKSDLFETVCFERSIIDIGKEKVPFTLSLIGFKDTYVGIKATAFFKNKLKEEGVFFRINSYMN